MDGNHLRFWDSAHFVTCKEYQYQLSSSVQAVICIETTGNCRILTLVLNLNSVSKLLCNYNVLLGGARLVFAVSTSMMTSTVTIHASEHPIKSVKLFTHSKAEVVRTFKLDLQVRTHQLPATFNCFFYLFNRKDRIRFL